MAVPAVPRSASYLAKLRDPRWQRRRLEILQRDEWRCQCCGAKEKTLHVHHRWYARDQEPWDATEACLVTLCEDCHAAETKGRHAAEAALLHELRRVFFAEELEALSSCIAEAIGAAGDNQLIWAALDVAIYHPQQLLAWHAGKEHMELSV